MTFKEHLGAGFHLTLPGNILGIPQTGSGSGFHEKLPRNIRGILVGSGIGWFSAKEIVVVFIFIRLQQNNPGLRTEATHVSDG